MLNEQTANLIVADLQQTSEEYKTRLPKENIGNHALHG